MGEAEATSAGRLPTGRLIAHSLISIPIAGAMLPLGTYLPAIYAQLYGVPLSVLGAIFLVERFWGTATDPLVGWLCDRTSSRFGRRKIWIAAGSVLFALSFYFLFFPFIRVTPAGITAALVILFFAWSMIVVPFYAWSSELSGDYHERTRISTYQTVIGNLSLVLILFLPALADHWRPGDLLLKLNLMGAAVLVPMIPGTLLALRAFPDSASAPPSRQPGKTGWREAARLVLGDSILLRVMAADFAILFAQGIRGGLIVFYVSFVIGMPQWASGIFLIQFLVSIAAAPIWQAIARRIGKHRALVVSELAQAAINFVLVLAGRGDLVLLLAMTVAQGLTQGIGNLLLRAMLADVADEQRLRSGVDRTAMLFSVLSISGKAGSAIPLGIGLPLIAWFGFNPVARTIPHSGLAALALLFTLGPALAHLVAALLVRGFSIDEARQAEIRRSLRRCNPRSTGRI